MDLPFIVKESILKLVLILQKFKQVTPFMAKPFLGFKLVNYKLNKLDYFLAVQRLTYLIMILLYLCKIIIILEKQ